MTTVMDIPAEIAEVKAELLQLKNDLKMATGKREIALINQITAKETQLTALIGRLPIETSGGKIISHFDFLFDAVLAAFLTASSVEHVHVDVRLFRL